MHSIPAFLYLKKQINIIEFKKFYLERVFMGSCVSREKSNIIYGLIPFKYDGNTHDIVTKYKELEDLTRRIEEGVGISSLKSLNSLQIASKSHYRSTSNLLKNKKIILLYNTSLNICLSTLLTGVHFIHLTSNIGRILSILEKKYI